MSHRRPKRLTVDHHAAFRREITNPPAPEFDEIDYLVADPLTERYAKPRKESKTANVLSILDELMERSGK